MDLSQPRVLFFHIPKTGGTSARHLLRIASHGTMVDADFLPVRYVVNQHAPACSFQGHLVFFPGDFSTLRNRYITTTLLRDPSSRLISQYFQFRRASDVERSPQADAAKTMSLMDYLGWIERRNSFEDLNTTCHWLATLASPGDRRLDGAEALYFARKAIAQFDIVGKTENLDAYAAAIGLKFGLPDISMPSLNKATDSEVEEISQEAVNAARRLSSLDYELYQDVFGDVTRETATTPSGVKDHSLSPVQFPPLDFGRRSLRICKVVAGKLGPEGIQPAIDCGDTLTIGIELATTEEASAFTLGFGIRNSRGELIYGTNSSLLGVDLNLAAGERRIATFQLPCHLQLGEYEVHVAIHLGTSHHEGCEHWLEPATRFRVVGSKLPGFAGLITFPTQVFSSSEASISLFSRDVQE